MIVTPRLVFLHLHKSGGTFVNQCLLRYVVGASFVGYHLPASLIPPQHAHLPRLGFVRSPWSYYVSWYAFQSSRPTPNALFGIMSANGSLGFAGTIRNMLLLGSDEHLLDRTLAVLPKTYVGQGLNLPSFALERIRDTGRGFYSFLYDYMFRPEQAIHVGRMESLREDLPRLLTQLGEDVTPQMNAFIAHERPLNSSTHDDVAHYFDPDLAALVERHDAEVIRRHSYAFG